MSVTYNHVQLSFVDSSGNVKVFYPKTTGNDVTIDRSNNTNIPSDVTTVQGLSSKLAKVSFSGAYGDLIDAPTVKDSLTSTSTTDSLSANQGKVLSDKLPFSLSITNNVYGYKTTSGVFIAFKSQADIDSAVAAAKVGTATADKVLTGYTFTNTSTSGLSGSMTNNGTTSNQTLNCGGSFTVKKGYHNTQFTVTANSLASQTGVDSGKTAAAADQILTGYQAWVNGSKVTGSMPNNSSRTSNGEVPNENYKNIMKGESYSNNCIRLQHKINVYKMKMHNYKKNKIDNIVIKLVRSKPKYITIEDLSIKNLLENNASSDLHKYIQNSMFRYFYTKLIDKSLFYDIEIRKADKFFASSKICSNCGYKYKNLTLSDRIYTCPSCGNIIDRDLNAAINLCNLKKYTIIKSL